jgi:hypothetical protein
MLAWTFYAQPLGYLTAAIVSIMVLASHRDAVPWDLKNRTCDQHCRQALDRSWRSIIGVGAIFAIIAFWFRRTTPESPRYTADVLGRPNEAREDVDLFLAIASSQPEVPVLPNLVQPSLAIPPSFPGPSQTSTSITWSSKNSNVLVSSHPVSGSSSQRISPQVPPRGTAAYDDTIAPIGLPTAPDEVPGPPKPVSKSSLVTVDIQSFGYQSRSYFRDFKEHFIGPDGRWRVLLALSIA